MLKRAVHLSICISISLALSLISPGIMQINSPAAFSRVFTMKQAQRLALADNRDYTRKYNEIILNQVKYQDAVKSVAEKRRNMSTFRWTPLLSFKFPEKPNLSEEMEFIFKPTQIQAQITTLQHELNDMKFQIINDVNDAFSEVYTLQEKIAFTEEVLLTAQKELSQNRYRLILGTASQNDIDVMEKTIESTASDLALQRRSFETAKQQLSDLAGMDVTTGYRFQNSLQTADIKRDYLKQLTDYTLEHNQAVFEAKIAARAATDNMDTAQYLMQMQYGGNMGMLEPYLTAVRQGRDIDTAAFQLTYMQFLQNIDSPWQGSKRILFIRIPKEWFKGQISGIRYVEDEPYALYTASLDYMSAIKDLESAKKDVTTQVQLDFEALVTIRNAYETMLVSNEDKKKELDRLMLLNKEGKATYEEIKDKRSDYQDSQMDALTMLLEYNQLLNAYDRLTCGGITKLLEGESLSLEGGKSGDSIAAVDEIDGPYYYITSRVQDMAFSIGISIPEDFEPEITHFELWYDGIQIGSRTAVARQLTHLTIAAHNDSRFVTIRFYNGDTYVDECQIDSNVLRGQLSLDGVVQEKQEEYKQVGIYYIKNQTSLGLTTFSCSIRPEENIGYYQITDQNGTPVYSSEPIPLEESLTYLSVLSGDLENLKIRLYDKNAIFVYEGFLTLSGMEIMVKTSN